MKSIQRNRHSIYYICTYLVLFYASIVVFLHSLAHSYSRIQPFSPPLSHTLIFSLFPFLIFPFFLSKFDRTFTWLDFSPKKIHVYAHVRIRQTKRTLLGGRMDHAWYVTVVIKIARYIWGRLAILRFISSCFSFFFILHFLFFPQPSSSLFPLAFIAFLSYPSSSIIVLLSLLYICFFLLFFFVIFSLFYFFFVTFHLFLFFS